MCSNTYLTITERFKRHDAGHEQDVRGGSPSSLSYTDMDLTMILIPKYLEEKFRIQLKVKALKEAPTEGNHICRGKKRISLYPHQSLSQIRIAQY